MRLVEPSAVQEARVKVAPPTPMLGASGLAYALKIAQSEGRIVSDPGSLSRYSIVRVLCGPLAGRIGLLTGVGYGCAAISVVAPELRRRRRHHKVRYETGLRTICGDKPHLTPNVGDEVDVWIDGWSGAARVCSISGRTAVVRSATSDAIASVDLGPDEPMLEVLFEPVMRLADDTEVPLGVHLDEAFAIPLHVNLAEAIGEFLLETFNARDGKL